ncbi:MAG: amidohydrolase family protein [Christensenellales bacterium]|jgi:predicted TIM-barrel fold metal-dependent hydrolase
MKGKIIDAHLHFWPGQEYFDEIALAAGHENTSEHLQKAYEENNIVMGIVMGNGTLEKERHVYPPYLRYCIGLDRNFVNTYGIDSAIEQVAWHLAQPGCVGLKLYPGYCQSYVSDQAYLPYYELARRMKKPIAIHTGTTAGADACLKYSHPLTVDEVAMSYPEVQFVLCHFGSPWAQDASAVMEKNPNVAADLSGLLEGKPDLKTLFDTQGAFFAYLRMWMTYVGDFDRFMFGTDWPLVNYKTYIRFIQRLVPEKAWQKVFFENANRIYQLNL